MQIDATTYDKAAHYPQRHGYQLRGTVPTSIVVHSTEGRVGQSLESAATYLYASADVSAHFLVGRNGEIIQFLDPKTWQAWHAGAALLAFSNARSIGIENLHAHGETWPAVQWRALFMLIQHLIATFSIPLELIDTHGQIAVPGPYRRKLDPTDWPHDDFLRWRATLANRTYRILGTPVYQEQRGTGPIAGWLPPGNVEVDETYPEQTAHLASGFGFIRLDDSVEAL